MRNDKENLIVTLTFEFALDIIAFCEELETAKKFAISKQLIRCGTSIGANVREAQNAESKADFIHKMKIAAKEADETEYFLLLCQFSSTYPFNQVLLDKLIFNHQDNFKDHCQFKEQLKHFQIFK